MLMSLHGEGTHSTLYLIVAVNKCNSLITSVNDYIILYKYT